MGEKSENVMWDQALAVAFFLEEFVAQNAAGLNQEQETERPCVFYFPQICSDGRIDDSDKGLKINFLSTTTLNIFVTHYLPVSRDLLKKLDAQDKKTPVRREVIERLKKARKEAVGFAHSNKRISTLLNGFTDESPFAAPA